MARGGGSENRARSPPVQLLALKVAGVVAFFVLGDTERADGYWARALTLAEELGASDDMAWISDRVAGVAWDRGDTELAVAQYRRSLDHHRASGNRLGEADSLHLLGETLRDMGDFEGAETSLVQAGVIFEELGMQLAFANNVHSLGDLELDRGDLTRAADHYRACLAFFVGSGIQRSIAYCVAGMASVLSDRGSEEVAASAWGAVCAAEETSGFRMIASERRRYEHRLSRLEETPAWRAGKERTLDQAVELAFAGA